MGAARPEGAGPPGGEVILETIVTTAGAAGDLNFAPMGITLEGERVLLRPFRGALTHRNLSETGEGVVNFTDNVLLFARCAVGDHRPAHRPAANVRGAILEDACHWREFRVEERDLSEERGRFLARVVAEGRRRDFMAFNRGKHAVIEASILATRVHLLGRETVLQEFVRLQPLVDKTGGLHEKEAFAYLLDHVERGARDR
jgi:hypothetical protein